MSSSSSTFWIKRGDTLPLLVADLSEASGDPIDLTGATVTIGVRRAGTRTPSLTGTATVVGDATAGRVQYSWAAGETDTLGVGAHEAEFQLSWTNGAVATVPSDGYIAVIVLSDIAP